jgi:hypothetical protein
MTGPGFKFLYAQNHGGAIMYEEIFSVLNVIALGLITGTVVGLLIGYAAKTQGPEWIGMTRQQKEINLALVTACSGIAIIVLSWRFLLP